MSHRVKLTLVILAAASVYLLGNGRVPLWDRDEPRNAQAARQMFQSGEWVVPRFLDKVRTAKPPFTYWMQAMAMHALGDDTFAARLPSALFMTMTLTALAIALVRWDDRERAFWTVFVLATSAIVIGWTAKTSLTDAVLLLWVSIAQLCLYALVRRRGSWPVVVTFAVAVGLALLTKGPVVVGLLTTTVVVWLLSFRWLARSPASPSMPAAGEEQARAERPSSNVFLRRPPRYIGTLKTVSAIMVIGAITLPWAFLVETRVPGFLLTSTSHDVARRIFEPLEQHFGPPGYYALMLWGIYFPWCVLLPLTLVIAWRHRREPRVRFALAAVIGPWLMLECVQTKLPHYLLPVFPPLAYLTADAIVRSLRREHDDLFTRGTRGGVAVWAMIVAGIGSLPAFLLSGPRIAALAIAVAGVLYGGCVLLFFLTRRERLALLAMGWGMMLVMTLTFGWYLPRAEFLRLSICVAELLRRAGGAADATTAGEVQMIAYKEPSLAFYQGGTIREQSENDYLATHPPEQWPRWTVIRADVWNRMPDNVRARMAVVGSCTGLDIADQGRVWTVYVLRKR